MLKANYRESKDSLRIFGLRFLGKKKVGREKIVLKKMRKLMKTMML